MEFRNRGFPAYPSNYTNFSDPTLEGGMWTGRSLVGDQGRTEILIDLEKKRIREEMFVEELARKRVLEGDIRREYLMRGHPDSHHLYRSQPLHFGQSSEPVVAMPFKEDYGGGSGRQPGGEVLGNPHVPCLSGAKRKSSSSPIAGSSAEISPHSKKKKNEWSCDICKVSASSERGLHDHLAGKKHHAKVRKMAKFLF